MNALKMLRIKQSDTATISELLAPDGNRLSLGANQISVLEPVLRVFKQWGSSAIGEGVFPLRIIRRASNNRKAILVEQTENFSEILFHPGNWIWDTHGCLLPGTHAKEIQFNTNWNGYNYKQSSFQVSNSVNSLNFLINFIQDNNITHLDTKNSLDLNNNPLLVKEVKQDKTKLLIQELLKEIQL